MGGFLRMIVYARRASDAEFVQALREQTTGRSPARTELAVLLLLLGVLCWIALAVVLQNLLGPEEPGHVRLLFLAGELGAAVAGVAIGYAAKAGLDWGKGQGKYRMARLLVEYHDRLDSHGLIADEDQPAGPPPPPEPPGKHERGEA